MYKLKNILHPFLLLIISSNHLFAQIDCTVSYDVGIGNIRNTKGKLFLSVENNTSTYIQYILENDGQVVPNFKEEIFAGNVDVPPSKELTGFDKRSTYQFDVKKDTLFTTEYIDKLFYVSAEKTPQLNWNITTETKLIDQINCTKATCSFRGRNYIAWFTPEIPITIGPWKFNGLPGLIIQVYTDDFNYHWAITEINYKKNNNITALPIVAKRVSINELICNRAKWEEYVTAEYNDFAIRAYLEKAGVKSTQISSFKEGSKKPDNYIEISINCEE